MEEYQREMEKERTFKARPVESKILEKPAFVPKKQTILKTEVQIPFNLQTEKRAQE